MIIDKNGKFFGKISIVDILLVIMFIAVLLFSLNKIGLFSPKDALVNNYDKIELVFYQEEMNTFTANNVTIGDPATESLQNSSFGNVTEVQIDDSVSWGSDIDGTQVSTSKEGYSSIYIHLDSSGTVGPNSLTIGGSSYYIGETITLRVGNSIFFGQIYDAKKK